MPEIFVTFPPINRISLAVGTTNVNFIDGIAVLPDSSTRSTARRIPRELPLRSIFIDTNQNINIKLTLNDEIEFQGFVPSGQFEIDNVTYDAIEITTTVVTDFYMVGSTDPGGVYVG